MFISGGEIMQWIERAKELINDLGYSLHDTGQIIQREFGEIVSDDTIRYHVIRKDKSKEIKEDGIEKILVMGCLHIPFHRENEIMNIILKHRNEINTIIFAGDLVDCEPISVFPKEQQKPLFLEMAEASQLLKRIDKLTPNIKKILIWGNHEYRFSSYLSRNKNELNYLHSTNILWEIKNGFVYHDKVNKKRYRYEPLSDNFTIIDKWYTQYGDMMVAHPKTFSKVRMKTATMTFDYFKNMKKVFNAVLIAHTHKWGFITLGDSLVGEVGCLCKAMEYANNGNISYTPQEYGYAIIAQKDGITDINNSKFYRLCLEDGDKKWQDENADLQ